MAIRAKDHLDVKANIIAIKVLIGPNGSREKLINETKAEQKDIQRVAVQIDADYTLCLCLGRWPFSKAIKPYHVHVGWPAFIRPSVSSDVF